MHPGKCLVAEHYLLNRHVLDTRKNLYAVHKYNTAVVIAPQVSRVYFWVRDAKEEKSGALASLQDDFHPNFQCHEDARMRQRYS